MFAGKFTHKVDGKGRVAFPKPLRAAMCAEELHHGLMLTLGFDRCLAVYTRSGWERFARRIRKDHDRSRRNLKRIFFSQSRLLALDQQSRLLLPPEALASVNLPRGSTEVVFVGIGEYIEVWNPADWDALERNCTGEFLANGETLFDFTDDSDPREANSQRALEPGESP